MTLTNEELDLWEALALNNNLRLSSKRDLLALIRAARRANELEASLRELYPIAVESCAAMIDADSGLNRALRRAKALLSAADKT